MRHELICELIDNYMQNLNDNKEVITDALYAYFESFNNDVLINTLKGFKNE